MLEYITEFNNLFENTNYNTGDIIGIDTNINSKDFIFTCDFILNEIPNGTNMILSKDKCNDGSSMFCLGIVKNGYLSAGGFNIPCKQDYSQFSDHNGYTHFYADEKIQLKKHYNLVFYRNNENFGLVLNGKNKILKVNNIFNHNNNYNLRIGSRYGDPSRAIDIFNGKIFNIKFAYIENYQIIKNLNEENHQLKKNIKLQNEQIKDLKNEIEVLLNTVEQYRKKN